MFLKQLGNTLIGKISTGEKVKIVQKNTKTITKLGQIIREKDIKSRQIKDEKEIFKKAFPQYNDFQLLLRHDKYSGNKIGTKDFGKLVGINKEGQKTILMRQNKVNSEFSDITLNYDSNKSVPNNPTEFESFKSEIKLYRSADSQICPTKYTEVSCPFARAYLKGDETLKATENATDEFYKIMRNETKNKI